VSCAFFLIALLPHADSAVAPALSDADVLERAAMEFQEGVRLRSSRQQARPRFANAAAYFEELRRRGVCNTLLYRNLGNAYLLADDLPHAILSYRRGLRQSPNNAALRESLAEARERVVYPSSGDLGHPTSDSRPPWLPYIRSSWLMLAALVCYGFGCVGLTRWLMVRRGRSVSGSAVSLLLAGVVASWVVIRAQEERQWDLHPLVVVARDRELLRRGNGMVFPPRYDTPLNRGVEGRLLFERRDWVQIELAGGEIGWLPRQAVLVDVP
jgi:hypothetical protein